MGTAVSLKGGSSKINRSAQALARYLGPSPLSKKVGSGDLMQVKKRLVPILNLLEKSKRSSGPTPKNLLEKAYEFRKEIGPHEAMVTTAAILANWELARSVGLFTEEGKYTDNITFGNDSGEKIQIENIVLPSKLPRFSAHLANVRLVEPSKKRKPDAKMTLRDAAYQTRLMEILDEMSGMSSLRKIEQGPKLNGIGQTMDQVKKIFKKEMEDAGKAASELPGIRLRGNMSATPSHKSGNRWRVSVDINNNSLHPTEVVLEWYIIGITEKKNQHYIMARGKQPLKLRKGQDVRLDLFTAPKSSFKKRADDTDALNKAERSRSRVNYRGFVMRVKHEKGIAAVAASDQRLLGYLDEDGVSISGLPDFSTPSKVTDEYR